MSCVSPTIKQMQRFKELQHKYDLHETTLESIVHEWINIEGNENTFPSDSFIQERIQGKPTMNASEAQIELWNKYYSKPIVVDTMEEAINIQDTSTEYFDDASIKVIRTENGKYKVTVSEPSISSDEKIAIVNTDSSNKRIAIGKNGINIERAKLLAKRQHDINNIILK